jgi:hypothetical protein
MKSILMAALSATAVGGFALATPAGAQETVTGAPRGTAPVTVEGYGPSSVVACNEDGYCWHSTERYDYPTGSNVVIHPRNWRWREGENYAWREHPGRGFWHGNQWRPF